jgi:hypothetical protein
VGSILSSNNAYVYADSDGYTYSYIYADSHIYTHCHIHSYSHGDIHSYTDTITTGNFNTFFTIQSGSGVFDSNCKKN